MNILSAGKLRERVKSSEVSAQEARQALLAEQCLGNVVSQDAIRWLGNFRPRRAKQEQAEEQPKQNKRRRRHSKRKR